MPRVYKKKGLKNKWTDKQLHEATGKVQRKELTLRAAAETYGIPRSTLSDHLRGVSSKRYGGCSTVLTPDEEREIVVTCQVLAEMGFPLTKCYVEVVVRDYLKSEGRSSVFGSSGLPGRSWWEGFLSRWPKLVERKPQHLSRHRAQCANQEVVDAFFGRLKKLFETSGLKDAPDLDKRIWNCDETGFCTAVASKAVLTKRGAKEVHETVGGSGRDYITVLGCGCASGERLPPYILYKGKNLYTSWTEGGPAGTLYGVSGSGWMEGANFLDWFKKLFLSAVQHLSSTPGVVLFVDGHHSHLTLELIELAKEKGVHLVCFPPHMTHVLQPLDVSVYHPVKQAWRAVLKEYKLESMADNVTKYVFPTLISKLWERSFKTSHLVSGFRATGLYPLDQAVVQGKLAPSVPFCPPCSSTSTSTASSGPSVPTSSVSGTLTLQGSGTLVIKGGCSHCGAELTPMRPHLTLHFEKLLKKKNADKKVTTNRKRVKPQYYGEALTSDEVFDRVKDDKASQKQPAKKRKRSPTPVVDDDHDSDGDTEDDSHDEDEELICQGCKKDSRGESEGMMKNWIGCDSCWRWFHYHCAGFRRKPSTKAVFKSSHCKK